jgi:uncharacterized membrane protein
MAARTRIVIADGPADTAQVAAFERGRRELLRRGLGLGDARSQADIANLAIELEMAAVAAYLDAQRKLIDAKLLQTGASIMANEAQHLVVLRQAVKRDPVPNAFETGKG